jgi:hypothetical protein
MGITAKCRTDSPAASGRLCSTNTCSRQKPRAGVSKDILSHNGVLPIYGSLPVVKARFLLLM